MKGLWKHHRPLTLWLGMYGITFSLFWYETGAAWKGLTLGLLSATLKTVWGLAHAKLFGKGCPKCQEAERILEQENLIEVAEGI